ncbi:serine/threonine-protein kinase [Streptomyces sp. GC420]|uniref:serine/threonine-protein kinase n=1 Tax=Streptomyces sp. GC420 TaxID=2697568 RepID=UPI00141523C6|nr:serine/threonine-protein kinase [Streptomyces sp. GC420]NBM15428.1 protein kinase [Streptomyces sp. GC420]
MQPLEAGEPQSMGPYRLLGRLGAGGMGRVYLGRSAGGRTVAVKAVHPHFALDEEFRARFRREVEAARRVGGAWTAPVLDADPDAPVPWVATGYVAGPSLAQAVTAHGPLPDHTVRTLGAGLAEALGAVHALGLVHRDVKPSNVLLTVDGPRLIDFGIARAIDGTASLTSSGVSIGSPGYMAPEQILGEDVAGASDVFSLGAVLAYAATGVSPFPGDSSAALLYKVVHEEPRMEGLDGELRELVEACLAKRPGARPEPAAVAGRLAPKGAAALVAGGWLPGPLVEQLGRTAVRLLDLEPQPQPRGAGAEPASGPIPFTTPSVGAPADVPAGASTGAGGAAGSDAARGAAGAGSFGPPDPSYAGLGAGAAGSAHAAPAPEQPPGRISVSLAATSVPGERRGRKLSCTVALAVAGALAAVTVGVGVLTDVLPGGGGDSASGAKDGGGAAAGPESRPSRSPRPGRVPEEFLGTWEGPVEAGAAGVTLPGGTLTLVVEQGRTGERMGTATQVDLLGASTCRDVLYLKSVTEEEVVAESRPGTKDDRCTQNRSTVRLTRVGAGLRYASQNPEGGKPKGLLEKQD